MLDLLARLFAGWAHAQADVVILVEPAPSHWNEARELGARVVLLCEGRRATPDLAAAVLFGADAVLDGTATPNQMRAAVTKVAAGGTVLTPAQARVLVELLRAGGPERPRAVHLTAREADILRCIEEGMSVKQTAIALGIAHKTVENLRSRLFRKLGARNRSHALLNAGELRVLAHAGS